MFSAGWLVLLAGSLVAGLASNVTVELIGRAVQGAGSALIAPSALTLLFMLFGANPKELPKALALYGAAAPAGGTAGVFLGGVITEYLSWPWVFYVNIPIALVILALVPAVMPAGTGSGRRVDILGALTVTSWPRGRGVCGGPGPRDRLGCPANLVGTDRRRGPDRRVRLPAGQGPRPAGAARHLPGAQPGRRKPGSGSCSARPGSRCGSS
nr:MFS transporter [Nocardioides convexus]